MSAENELHDAICNAVILLNNGEETAPEVSAILRTALAKYNPAPPVVERGLQQAQVVGLQVSAGVHEALQRMIEDGPIKGPASEQDAILVSDWYRRITQGATPQSSAPVVGEHIRRLVGKLAQWQHCMSYNDSYFGEPAGLVKQVTAELVHAADPIYPPLPEPVDPLAGVTIYTSESALTGRGTK